MNFFVAQVVGTLILLIFSGLIAKFILTYYRNKKDLELYTEEYRRVKEESDKFKIKLDTINHIYKNYEIQILSRTSTILEELNVRLPRISRKYIISRIR